MDLGQLEVFLAVAREKKFSRAAEKLHRTQSAVSQSIHKLEEDIGEPLLDRSSRDGLLTDAGRVLQEYAERLLNLRDDASGALAELRELHRGKLTIAANEFTALYLLPVLGEFRRLHPMIRIVVQRSLGSHIPDDLLRHNSELGVLTYDPEEPQLRSIVVYLDELIFVVPPTHPLASESDSEHSAAGSRVICRAHRFFSISRKSDSGIQAPQNSLAHGHRTPHSAGNQTFRGDGKRSCSAA